MDKSLGELAESNCVRLHPSGIIESTSLGKIMSYYYLSHKTIRSLIKHAKKDARFEDVLAWMCLATEFDDLPVRHNEDIINAELSRNLPLSAENLGLPMWDPHVKAFLLLEAYMSRVDLPITDYVGDQNSILDQSIRIIQASIDILSELGLFSSSTMMMALLQCLKSACWPNDNPMCILPGVDIDKERRKPKVDESRPSLLEITTLSKHTLKVLLLSIGVPANSLAQAEKVVDTLPILKIGVVDVSSISLTVNVTRLNSAMNPEYRIWAPRFPKPQSEGFYIVVTDVVKDEVLALKRIGWQSGKKRGDDTYMPMIKSVFRLPSSSGLSQKVDVIVTSDSYVGMVWKIRDIHIP